MADEVGLSQLTLAALAARLGVRQPSLYKHIDGMAGLHRSIALRAKAELADVLARAAVGRSGWRRHRVHGRGLPAVGARPPRPVRGGPAGARWPGTTTTRPPRRPWSRSVPTCWPPTSSHGDDAIDAIRALRSTLHGFVSLESRRRVRAPRRHRPQLRPTGGRTGHRPFLVGRHCEPQ